MSSTSHIPSRVVLLHWLALLLALGSLASGLRLYASSRLAGEPAWAAWLPTGNVHALHLLLASLWAVMALAYTVHHFLSRRTAPAPASAPARRGERANLLLIRVGRWLLGTLLVSGLAVYLWGALARSDVLLPTHRYLAFVFAAWVLVHSALQLLASPWVRVRAIVLLQLKPRALLQLALVLPAVAGAVFLLLRAQWDGANAITLRAPAIPVDVPIEIDGRADEPAWQQAPAVEVMTLGVGEYAKPVPVRVQALRQGGVIRFLFSWPDSTHSVEHLPLLKTAQGWVVQQTQLLRNDELQFYEDKFSIMLSPHGDAAGDGSMQVGGAAPAGKPAHVTRRGYHATAPGGLVDMWHWKAVRTPYEFGQLDDNHVGPAYPGVPGGTRYTAGYKNDPSLGGGYSENWTWLREGVVTPKRLPRDPALLEQFQQAVADGDKPLWGMSWYETLPYDPKRDHYPVGTRMPSVLWTSVLEGDRGEVRARGLWHDGRWTLEVTRGLRAESPFDRDIADGTFLWVAPFDHTQIRHNYHLRPLRLRIEEPTS
jgi:hypothetical protein